MLLMFGERVTQQRAIDAGAAPAIVACMRAFPRNKWVDDGCMSFGNLLAGVTPHRPQLPAHVAADAVAVLVSAMDTFRGLDFQPSACNALSSLRTSAYPLAARRRIAAAVVAAMTAHARSVDMQMNACNAMFSIALVGAEDDLGEYDRPAAFAAVFAALRAHASQPCVVQHGSNAMRALLRDSALTMSIDALMDAARLNEAAQRTHPRLEAVTKLAATVSDFVRNMKFHCVAQENAALLAETPPAPAPPPPSPPGTPVVTCARPGCGATSTAVRLLQCRGCHNVSYCSCDCQKQSQHWRVHKAACFAVKAARSWKL
jgi:hypothetical protein